jgi:hypothetical protein
MVRSLCALRDDFKLVMNAPFTEFGDRETLVPRCVFNDIAVGMLIELA